MSKALRDKRYRERNRDRIKMQRASYRARNKERIREAGRLYSNKNRERILARVRKWKKDNAERSRAWYREYTKRRRLEVDFRILTRLRSRTYDALRRGRGVKSKATLDLLGCTIPELKAHLSRKFTKGMSWKNYGYRGWHVDHIIPCDSFDLRKVSEQRKCFHYSNLQPLWGAENISKGAK